MFIRFIRLCCLPLEFDKDMLIKINNKRRRLQVVAWLSRVRVQCGRISESLRRGRRRFCLAASLAH